MRRPILFMTFMLTFLLTGCGHEHVWKDADCTYPKTCVDCGVTKGLPLEHVWQEATCVTPKTCSACGETSGSVSEHTWQEATCTTPKTCSACGKVEGEVSEHEWQEATCTLPKTCSACGASEGEMLEHDLDGYGDCKLCRENIGTPLTTQNYMQYLALDNSSGSKKMNVLITPIRDNVIFKDVVLSLEYEAYDEDYYKKYEEYRVISGIRVEVDEDGYGSLSQWVDHRAARGGAIYPKVHFVCGYAIKE